MAKKKPPVRKPIPIDTVLGDVIDELSAIADVHPRTPAPKSSIAVPYSTSLMASASAEAISVYRKFNLIPAPQCTPGNESERNIRPDCVLS